jgi:hypothetical protein
MRVLVPQGKICKFTGVCIVSFCRETGIKYKIIPAKLTNLSLGDEYSVSGDINKVLGDFLHDGTIIGQ